MGFISEFKEFAMRGNLVDMAVAFVMGGAFGKIVSAFVDGMVMPLVSLLTAGKDFTKLVWVIKPGTKEVIDEAGNVTTAALEPVAIKYGEFITVAIDFIIVAFVMFLIVKGINKLKKKQEEVVAPAGPTQEELLSEIRDLLKK